MIVEKSNTDVEDLIVQLDANVTVTWKSGIMYLHSLTMMGKETIQN